VAQVYYLNSTHIHVFGYQKIGYTIVPLCIFDSAKQLRKI